MKYPFSTLLLLLFSALTNAQEPLKKIHFGLSVAPQINISNFKSDRVFNNPPSLGMAIGGEVCLDLSEHTQFRTGLNLQSVTLKHRDYSPHFVMVVNGQLVPIESYWDFNTAYTFLGLPIGFRFISGKGRDHFYFSGGVEIEYKLYSLGSIEAIESGVRTSTFKPDDFPFKVKPVQLFTTSGFGYQWCAGKNIISLGPVIEYSVTEIFQTKASALRNGHLLLFGIRFSYNYC